MYVCATTFNSSEASAKHHEFVEGDCSLVFCGGTQRITWQRGRGRLGAGRTQQLHIRGMKPASLPLLSPSLDKVGRKGNQTLSGYSIN